ncbi:MAG: hypothetical protein ACJAY8_000267 [Sphingobacteriales bacterium]|jgi:hypothetical protein
MKKALLFLSLIAATTCFSQDNIPFTTPTWDCNFHERGLLFFNADQSLNGLMNKTLNASPLFASHIWISSKDSNNFAKVAVGQYGSGADFVQGPFRNTNTYRPNSFINITREEITYHQAHFNDIGYTMPPSIKNWPAIGDTATGESLALAPFMDINKNECYDPENGDYPAVRGDYALYFIYANGVDFSTASGSAPMNIEVHTMIYGFIDSLKPTINEAVFMRHTLINHSSTSQNIRFGQWFDFDLGNPLDDFIGSAPEENTVYVYNGDNNDDANSLTPHFGENPPAFGIRYLDKPLDCLISYPIGQSNIGDPVTPMGYENYMNGFDKIGQPWRDNNNLPTKIMYPGDPVTETGWTESSGGNSPGDRRCISSFGNEEFAPGERLHYDLTMYLGNGGNSNLENITNMKKGLTTLSDFFEARKFDDGVLAKNKDCQTSTIKDKTTSQFSLFPNPSNGQLVVQSQVGIKTATLLGSNGARTNTTITNNGTIIVPQNLANGLYILEVQFRNGVKQHQKFLLQR